MYEIKTEFCYYFCKIDRASTPAVIHLMIKIARKFELIRVYIVDVQFIFPSYEVI